MEQRTSIGDFEITVSQKEDDITSSCVSVTRISNKNQVYAKFGPKESKIIKLIDNAEEKASMKKDLYASDAEIEQIIRQIGIVSDLAGTISKTINNI